MFDVNGVVLVFLLLSLNIVFLLLTLIHGTQTYLLNYFLGSFFAISLEQHPRKHLPVQSQQ